MLHISKGLCKSSLRIVQTVGALAEEIICGCVQGEAEKQRTDIDGLAPTGRVAPFQQRNQVLDVFLKDFSVNDAIPDKHRSDEMA